MMSEFPYRLALTCAVLSLSLRLAAGCGPQPNDTELATAEGLPAGPLTIALENEAAVSQSVDEAGTTIRTTAADGTIAELRIPALALPGPETITVTPVRELQGLPVSGQLLAAVHFEPHGLSFARPLTLSLTIPKSVDPEAVLAYTYDDRETSETVAFVPLGDYDAATATAELTLYHFSGAGIATGDTNDIRSNLAGVGDGFRQEAAIAQREAGSRDELVKKLSAIYIAWFEQLLGDPIQTLSGEGLESTRDVAEAYASWLGDLLEWQCKLDGCGPNLDYPPCFADSGFDPKLDTLRTYAAEKFYTHYASSIEELRRRCDAASTLCAKKALLDEDLQWNELSQLGGVTYDSCRSIPLPNTQLKDEPQGASGANCTDIRRELFSDVFFNPSDAIYLLVGDQAFLELGALSISQRNIDAGRDYGKRAWGRATVHWLSNAPDVASVTEVTEQCNLPCGRGIVVTPKAPGRATITGTASGDGICDGNLQTSVEVVVDPDTRAPVITGGGDNAYQLILDTPQTVQLRVAANDGRPLHYMYDGLRGGTGVTQAVFYRDTGFYAPGQLLGTAACADGVCTYSHTLPACFESPGRGGLYGSFAWGAIVYDAAGNASEYRLVGSFVFGTSNPPPC